MRAERSVAGAVVAAALLLLSCDSLRQVGGQLAELRQIQEAVSKLVGGGEVTVDLTNARHLTIGLINSALKDIPADEKKAKALEIARLGYASLSSRATVESVRVVFVVQHSYFFLLHYTNTTDGFGFDVAELSSAKSDVP